ncbi:hypothetical protein PMAYCL1PPCAC_16642, partial [Pristionchus mayeri]
VDVDLRVDSRNLFARSTNHESAVSSRLLRSHVIVEDWVVVVELDADITCGTVVAHQLASDGHGLREAEQTGRNNAE